MLGLRKMLEMETYLKHDDWKIWEDHFHVDKNEVTESIMSLGNGKFGLRGNFEESFTGPSLPGSYIGGIWFPDKTRVGWWKNGYPDYFAKVINSVNWIGINLAINGKILDLGTCRFTSFYRELNLKTGILSKTCKIEWEEGKYLHISSRRFCSVDSPHLAQIHYEIRLENLSGKVRLSSYLNGDVRNKDSNHDEHFWEEVFQMADHEMGYVQVKTKPNPFEVPQYQVGVGMKNSCTQNGTPIEPLEEIKSLRAFHHFDVPAQDGDIISLTKTVVISHTLDHKAEDLYSYTENALIQAPAHLEEDHIQAWGKAWEEADIQIEGDLSAQIGIRFNIFHLLQTYNGKDARLNIGPKGFTGEKYGGVTYWDTEAYCIPFYLSSCDFSVAKNLLMYRYRQLPKAIENAEKLGFSDGAALYPMVTMNGEECHNEWEITFEEIHRNGAIAYAIYDYTCYTGDENYVKEFGWEVLVAISRFWEQRVQWSDAKKAYVILGVTGPNEYENNVNNNWYTNYIAVWTLKYTLECIKKYKKQVDRTEKWQAIIDQMYFPYDQNRMVFLQQDGFLDKELLNVDQIKEHRPINQKWSWDRILRSCFIKQADVLQGIYFFEEDFDLETVKRNFDFYEPMTVHESSLSPCVHSILACRIGQIDKAYEMYLRTSRLDLDNYNQDTEDGLHITSMAGTWLSVVKGFAGLKVRGTQVEAKPNLPSHWKSLSFSFRTVEGVKRIRIENGRFEIKNI